MSEYPQYHYRVRVQIPATRGRAGPISQDTIDYLNDHVGAAHWRFTGYQYNVGDENMVATFSFCRTEDAVLFKMRFG